MKRKFQLTGAILSIIIGSLSLIGVIIILSANYSIDYYSNGFYHTIAGVFSFGFSISLIVLGALFCINKKSHGVAIALLAIIGLLVTSQILMFGDLSIIAILIELTSIAMIIVYLSIDENLVVNKNTAYVINNQQGQNAILNKIEILTILKNNGTLTEEEFKSYLKKELEK